MTSRTGEEGFLRLQSKLRDPGKSGMRPFEQLRGLIGLDNDFRAKFIEDEDFDAAWDSFGEESGIDTN